MSLEEFLDIKAACRIIGGEDSPIHPATYYRGVKAGRYPAPEHPSPGISRIRKRKLVDAISKIVGE